MNNVYEKVLEFKNKFPGTVAWRLKKHCEVIEGYINPDEYVLYAFCGQKNEKWYDLFTSCVIVLTNKRLLIGQKRVVFGSIYTQITPDLYNDMRIYRGLLFGKITIAAFIIRTDYFVWDVIYIDKDNIKETKFDELIPKDFNVIYEDMTNKVGDLDEEVSS